MAGQRPPSTPSGFSKKVREKFIENHPVNRLKNAAVKKAKSLKKKSSRKNKK